MSDKPRQGDREYYQPAAPQPGMTRENPVRLEVKRTAPQPNPTASVWWQEEMDDLKRQLAEARLELAQTQQEWADHECADLKRQLDEARAELNETRAQNCRLRKLSGYDETHPMESRPPSQPAASAMELAASLIIPDLPIENILVGKGTVHSGDCTKECHSCLRCQYDEIEEAARKIEAFAVPSQPGSVQDTCIHGFLPWMPDQGEPLCSCHLKSKGSVQECHRRTAEALNRAIVGHPTTRDDQIWWASASAAHRYAEIIARECPVPQLSEEELLKAAYKYLDAHMQVDGLYADFFRRGMVPPFQAHLLAKFAADVIDRLTGRKEGE